VNEDLVIAAHAAGLAVNTWTCDDPDRIRWLADLGVDAVVTNVPDVALTALGR
jgi:glycerophosphoryl diester phosphodiesterase